VEEEKDAIRVHQKALQREAELFKSRCADLWDSPRLATGLSRLRVLVGSGVLAVLVLLWAVASAAVLSPLPSTLQMGVLSFGVAALLYLVTEELLVEAHEVAETMWAAALFFVGFLLFLVLGLFG
jgi:zinc transporter ZupT